MALGRPAAMLTPRDEDEQRRMIVFGRTVTGARVARGWTQERLAEECDVSTRHVHQIERGLANCSVLMLLRLADALGTTAAALVSAAASALPSAEEHSP